MKLSLVRAAHQDLTVIEPIQRKVRPPRVRAIAREWNPAYVGILEAVEILDPESGVIVWHLIDGQTRWLAGQIADPNFMYDVVVRHELTTEQEAAAIFLARNQLSAKVPALDQYNVGIVADKADAIAVKVALLQVGLDVGETASPTTIGAVSALMSVVRRAKKKQGTWTQASEALVYTMRTIVAAWPKGGAHAFNGNIIQAVGRFYADRPELFMQASDYSRNRLIDKMALNNPDDWGIMARSMVNTSGSAGGGAGQTAAIHRLFVSAYNQRLSLKNKL